MPVFINELISHIRFADLIDIGLVSVLLYAFITMLRESTSLSATRRTLLAITAFALVYGLAVVIGLYLVKTIIEVLLIVLLVGAVIVFQSDIRRMVDRIGTWGPFRRTPAPISSLSAINVLVEASARLADSKTGALIALRGREPWDRHIEGGIRLGGKVSLPLLCSLFNPASPGHDGVVLMEGDRVQMFGAHLPLSSNLPEASQYGGTRHAAGLGLSEETDALVIIISEERGSISIAERGRLEEMGSVSDLKARLTQFWRKHYNPQASAAQARWWYKRSWQTGLLSLSLALLLWFLFAYRPETVYRTFMVPVELRNLKPEWSLEDSVPSEARVTLLGSEQAYRLLDPASLVISLDLTELEDGKNEFIITEENLQLPSNIRLYNVRPQPVEITAEQQRAVTVPVLVQTAGELPDSLELGSIRTDPETVVVAVTEKTKQPREITTEPINLSEIKGPTRLRRKLLLTEGIRLQPQQSTSVTVHVEVRPKPDGTF